MNDKILFELSKAANKIKKHIQKRMKEKGIHFSTGQSGILFLLAQTNGLKMSELGNVLKTDNSAITRMVDSLEKTALVTREPNPEDRRQHLICITAEGRHQSKIAAAIANETNATIKEGFSDKEIDIFLNIINSFEDKF